MRWRKTKKGLRAKSSVYGYWLIVKIDSIFELTSDNLGYSINMNFLEIESAKAVAFICEKGLEEFKETLR